MQTKHEKLCNHKTITIHHNSNSTIDSIRNLQVETSAPLSTIQWGESASWDLRPCGRASLSPQFSLFHWYSGQYSMPAWSSNSCLVFLPPTHCFVHLPTSFASPKDHSLAWFTCSEGLNLLENETVTHYLSAYLYFSLLRL